MAGLQKVRELTVDTMIPRNFSKNEVDLKTIYFYQGDINSAKFLLNITHEGAEQDLSTATKVQIAFLKPDGKRVFQECRNVNPTKGKYYVVLDTQSIAAAGNVVAQIRITFPDTVVETTKFVFSVEESIMSDEAIESSDEFPAIQKAIEAGEKLEGVDIPALVASKETAEAAQVSAEKAKTTADGSLPKIGGTMTDNIDMDTSVGSKSKGYRWRDATGALFGLESATDGALILYDYKNLARVWQYDPVAKRFTVLSDTNLLKTTGGTITGTTTFEAGDLRFKNAANDILFQNNTSGIFSFYDIAQNQVVWSYNPTTKEFAVNSASNLLKKTGDTMTGNFNFDVSSGEKSLGWRGGTTNIGFISGSTQNWRLRDWANSKDVFSYDGKTFNVLADSNLVTKTKNGRATITVTADAELISANGVIADRRGNTVTLRAPIRRKAGSTNGLVFTLPVDMRPTMTLSQTVITNDGAAALITLSATTGEVSLQSLSSTIAGKDINILITYVAD
ncbi:TPA: BppU family phage baseplate upper protein [Bacillus paranthracis]